MTSQQTADRDLAVWQANRALTPRERMELLQPAVSAVEYDATLRRVSEEMSDAY